MHQIFWENTEFFSLIYIILYHIKNQKENNFKNQREEEQEGKNKRVGIYEVTNWAKFWTKIYQYVGSSKFGPKDQNWANII